VADSGANSSAVQFSGASAVIFGGAKGIGKAVAIEWAARGARVAIADIDGDAARQTAGEIASTGGTALALTVNVLSPESMEQAAQVAEAAHGPADIVMNNVGAILNGHPLDIPMDEWHRIFELNYFSIVRSNAIFLPAMIERGRGHVVNTASFAGLYPYAAGRIPYASSKAAVISIWGMTEVLAVTTVKIDDPAEKASGSDGCVTPHTEIRIVDGNGAIQPVGKEGILETRGATICVGYLKQPEAFVIRDGWFDTGDLARLDADGYIRITGRKKDIIIRGGENISVAEIEGLLFKHPAISAVAIVAMPDERLGERACAYACVTPGCELRLQDITSFLAEQGVAKVYFPERLEVIEQMPMTVTGKIQKFELREWAKALA